MTKKETPKKKLYLKVMSIVGYLLMVSMVVFVAFMLVSNRINSRVPMLGGYSILKVQTPSMVPTLPVGSTIVIKNKDFDSLYVGDGDANTNDGDIISFYAYVNANMDRVNPDTYTGKSRRIVITHRIASVELTEDGAKRYITKGDNTNEIDLEPVTETDSSKPPFYITEKEYIGAVDQSADKLVGFLKVVNSPLGMIMLVFIPLSIVLLSDLIELINVLRNKKKCCKIPDKE